MAIEQKITYQPFVTPGMRALQTGQRAQTQFGTLADMARLQLAKDIEIEERAQEAEKLRLAAVQKEMLKKAFNNLKKNPSKDSFREGTRIFNFIKDTPKNFKHLAKEMNSLPVVAPIVGGSIYSQVKPIKRKKQ